MIPTTYGMYPLLRAKESSVGCLEVALQRITIPIVENCAYMEEAMHAQGSFSFLSGSEGGPATSACIWSYMKLPAYF
jgi:hypothetical protein